MYKYRKLSFHARKMLGVLPDIFVSFYIFIALFYSLFSFRFFSGRCIYHDIIIQLYTCMCIAFMSLFKQIAKILQFRLSEVKMNFSLAHMLLSQVKSSTKNRKEHKMQKKSLKRPHVEHYAAHKKKMCSLKRMRVSAKWVGKTAWGDSLLGLSLEPERNKKSEIEQKKSVNQSYKLKKKKTWFFLLIVASLKFLTKIAYILKVIWIYNKSIYRLINEIIKKKLGLCNICILKTNINCWLCLCFLVVTKIY